MLAAPRRSGIGIVVATLACLYSATAHAQWSGHATASYGRGLGATSLGQGNLSLGRNALRERAARRSNAAQPVQASGRHDVALTYTPDPQLTEKIRVSMIDLASEKNPASRPVWEKAMAGDAILRDFDGLMTAKGYSRLNFADDVAMLLSVCWEVVNDRYASEAQFRGAHAQMRSAAQSNPKLRSLPNAERQALSGDDPACQQGLGGSHRQSGATGRAARERRQGGEPVWHRCRAHAAHREGIPEAVSGG
jgi:hypothetical protein